MNVSESVPEPPRQPGSPWTLESLSPRATENVISAVICIAGLLCYLPLLLGDFKFVVFDDDIAIYMNPNIRSLDWASIRWMFTDVSYTPRYYPLTWLGLAVSYQFSGLDPLGYHAGNLMFHLLNGVLLFRLLKMLLIAAQPEPVEPARQTDVIAGLAALLWVLHPLRVDSVAWAAMRLYSQSTFFLLICLVCYVRAAGAAIPPFRNRWYWGSVLAFTASLLSHQLALTLVGVLCVLDIYPLKRFRTGRGRFRDETARRIWLEKLPFVVVALATVAITLWARSNATGIWNPPGTLEAFPLLNRVMQAFYIWAHYVWKPWWPLHLSPVYTTLFSFDPAAPAFVASAVLVVGVTVLAILLRRKYPVVLAAWSCHLILLVPVLGPLQHPHYPSDRYAYMQGLVWSVVLAAGLVSLWSRLRTRVRPLALLAVPVGLLIVFGAMTSRQVRVWTNSETLFKHVLAGLGDDYYRWDTYWRLGKYYLLEGRFAEAISRFDQTLALNPTEPQALYLKGHTLLQLGEDALLRQQPRQTVDEFFLAAAEFLDRSAAVLPTPEPLGAAGFAYAHLGRLPLAEDRLVRGLQLSPGDIRMRLGLGMVLHRQGRITEARELLERVIQDVPELADQREQILKSWDDFAPGPAPQ